MKKLLLCSNSSSEVEINDNTEAEPDNPQDNIKKLKTLLYEVDNLNNINFNYDKIVHFVSQGNDFQIKVMTRGDLTETCGLNCGSVRWKFLETFTIFTGLLSWEILEKYLQRM